METFPLQSVVTSKRYKIKTLHLILYIVLHVHIFF